VFGAGFGATQNLTLVVAFARAGPAQVTTASAVWNGAFDAGTALGAVAVGAVAAGLGFPLAFVGCAIVVAAALPLAGTRGQGGTR
jgi:predicted MFS family arabinose efflux permease